MVSSLSPYNTSKGTIKGQINSVSRTKAQEPGCLSRWLNWIDAYLGGASLDFTPNGLERWLLVARAPGRAEVLSVHQGLL